MYTDSLIEISEDGILFPQYYFSVGSQPTNLNDVESVNILKPTFTSGKWRIHGTGGGFGPGFVRDKHRPSREAIFILKSRKGKAT